MEKEFMSRTFVNASSMVDFINSAEIKKEDIVSIYGNKDMHNLIYVKTKQEKKRNY